MSIDKIHGKDITPETIWMCRQNIPELIDQDAIQEFGLDEEQAERMRKILLVRGVNKWFFARRRFIDLKHQVKDMLQQARFQYEDMDMKDKKEVYKILQHINEKMQNIAKLPRWIEWGTTITHDWNKIESNIIIKGKKC